MKFSKSVRTFCALFMALWLTHLPSQAVASKAMIPTTSVVTEMSRAEAQAKVQNLLSEDKIRQALEEKGLKADEINSRLAHLSDQEMQDLAGQIEQARYGGDILVTVLVVVLIIYFIKRI